MPFVGFINDDGVLKCEEIWFPADHIIHMLFLPILKGSLMGLAPLAIIIGIGTLFVLPVVVCTFISDADNRHN